MADSGILNSDVFNRKKLQGAEVSSATYNLVIGLVLCNDYPSCSKEAPDCAIETGR